MNSSSFFSNRECRYFPCHQTEDPEHFNCLFCYCPLYTLGEACGGHFTYTEKGIKNCTACTVPHGPDAAAYILSRFSEIAQKAGLAASAPGALTPEQERSLFPKDGAEIFREWNRKIVPLDREAMQKARNRWDGIAKPLNGYSYCTRPDSLWQPFSSRTRECHGKRDEAEPHPSVSLDKCSIRSLRASSSPTVLR